MSLTVAGLRGSYRPLPGCHLLIDPARPLSSLRIVHGDRQRADPFDGHLGLVSVLQGAEPLVVCPT